jgi:hypothetical protein
MAEMKKRGIGNVREITALGPQAKKPKKPKKGWKKDFEKISSDFFDVQVALALCV